MYSYTRNLKSSNVRWPLSLHMTCSTHNDVKETALPFFLFNTLLSLFSPRFLRTNLIHFFLIPVHGAKTTSSLAWMECINLWGGFWGSHHAPVGQLEEHGFSLSRARLCATSYGGHLWKDETDRANHPLNYSFIFVSTGRRSPISINGIS